MRKSDRRGVAKGEFIGLAIEIVGSNDPTLLGLAGTVVDETRNTFLLLRPDGRETRVGKRGQRFRLGGDEGAVLDGDAISYSPEDRTKKAR